MNFTLFKSSIKSNRMIWLIITCVLSFYLSIMMTMFDPENAQMLEEMFKMLPDAMVNMMGFSHLSSDFTTFISTSIYGFLIYMFPLIFVIIVNNRLIAKHVDRGSMAYILSTPNSRKKIATTQAIFSLTSIAALIASTTIISILMAQVVHPGLLKIGTFIVLNLYTIVFYFMVSGIAFFASCIFNESGRSLAVGGGIPLGFFVIQMLSNATEKLDVMKFFTIFTLYSPDHLMAGDYLYVVTTSIILFVIAILLYLSAIHRFNQRDLPL